MRIAVASGKGGTGKTTVATNLAYVAAQDGASVAYLDCDVEEPNGHLFLKPNMKDATPVTVPVPQVDARTCVNCGECAEFCEFNAIVCIGDKVLLFPELCHWCGGCTLVCPVNAITEHPRRLGETVQGDADGICFVHGLLDIGEAKSTPIIKAVKNAADGQDLVFVDAPPGTSCPVIETLHEADFVILVTEPTPFGLNDLRLAVGMVRAMGLPFGVVINRAGMGNDEVQDYCNAESVPILEQIPDDRQVAEAYSRGAMAAEVLPDYADRFRNLLATIQTYGGVTAGVEG